MQFTTITAILATAMAASATPLDARQVAPSVRGTFYSNSNGCNGASTGQTFVFVQDAPGVCHNLTVPVTITDTKFDQNTLTRTINFSNKPCGQSNFNFISVGPNFTGCKSQFIASYTTV